MNKKEVYERLVAQANIHARNYYFLGQSTISDAEYDMLIRNIEDIESETGYIASNSPTQKVGWYEKLPTGGREFKHKYQKCYSLENKREEPVDTDDYIVTPKLDGCSGVLYYEEGMLVAAVTRGDGTVGQDVTHLITYIKGVPSLLNEFFTGRIEGEFMCPDFDTSMGKNHRNYVAGSLGLKEAAPRKLEFFSYNVVYSNEDTRPDKYTDILYFLRTQDGIQVVDWCTGEHPTSWYKEKFAEKYKYTDGLVYKLNNTANWDSFTAHHPNFAFAFKFPEKEYQTQLIGVQWQVGRSGQITPVAILEPVDIEGTTVSKASLANTLNIKARGIKMLDTVNVIRAGAVIPQVVSVAKKHPDRYDIEIYLCPNCKGDLENRNGLLFCNNKACSTKKLKALEYFASTMKMKGVGPASIAKLHAEGLLNTVVDFFRLSAEDIYENTDISTKVASTMISSIEEAKKQPRYVMWSALGIPRLGKTAAKRLYEHTTSLVGITCKEVEKIKGFGKVIGESVELWSRNNQDVIETLENIFPAEQLAEIKGNIVITGKMDVPRKEIVDKLEKAGWNVMSSVSRSTDLLLYGRAAGSKLDKARVLGVKTVDYYASKSITNLL